MAYVSFIYPSEWVSEREDWNLRNSNKFKNFSVTSVRNTVCLRSNHDAIQIEQGANDLQPNSYYNWSRIFF